MNKIEDIIENINGFGKYQKIRYILICLSGLLPPIASYMHQFIAASPKYSCSNRIVTFDSNLDYYYKAEFRFKCTETNETDLTLFDNNLTESIINPDKNCTAWNFDKRFYQMTLTEEWNLVCDKAIWRSTMQLIYFSGISVGSVVLSKLAKRCGQKPVLITSLLLILIGSCLLSFGPQKPFGVPLSYFFLASGRFLIAIGSYGVSINGYLLAMETIGRANKKICALIFEFFFSFGQLVLVLAAYFLREWRHLTFIILLPCLPFILFICLTHESIPYLAKKKRYDEIFQVLNSIAKSNKTQLDETAWKSFLIKENEKFDKTNTNTTTNTTTNITTTTTNTNTTNVPNTEQEQEKIKDTRPHFVFILILVLNWIICNFVFHGIGLRANDLGTSPYLTFSLSAIVELMCSVFTFKILQFDVRRKLYFVLMLLCGVCCTAIYFSKSLIITIISALIAKFSISASYAIIRFYSSELFDESLRTRYLSNCSLMARVGSVIAPLIIGVGDYHFKQIPFLIFGTSCFASAITSLGLPKILKEKLTPLLSLNHHKSQQYLQNNWLDGQDVNAIDELEEEEEVQNETTDLSHRNSTYQQSTPIPPHQLLQPTLDEIEMLNQSNQSIYETPNQSELHLNKPSSHKSVQTSNITITTTNATTTTAKSSDKSTQATQTNMNLPTINRSSSLYKNKHFMIKRTPNMAKKTPQHSNPNLIRKTSVGFEDDSFYTNLLNQTTNL